LLTERRIFANTAVLGAGEAVGQMAGLVFVVLCGRAYGAGVLGWYSLGMAAGAIAAVVVRFGTHGQLLREIAQAPEESGRSVGGVLPYQVGLSVLSWATLAGLAAALIDDDIGRRVITLVGLYHILMAVVALLLLPLVARQILWPGAVTAAVQRVLIVLGAGLMISLGYSAGSVFLAFPLAALVLVALTFVGVYRFIDDASAWRANSWADQRAVYAAGLPFFGAAVLNVLYARLALLMIVPLAGEGSAGIYAAADRLILVFGIGQALFINAQHPAMLRLSARDRERALELASRCMRLLLVLTIPFAGFAAIFHREITLLVFGPSFGESARVLAVLAFALVVKGVNGLQASHAVAIGSQNAVLRSRAVTVALFALSGSGLAVVAGPLGLAAALLFADLVHAVMLHRVLEREGFVVRPLSVSIKPLLSLSAGLLVYLAMDGIALPLRAVCVATAIIIAIGALGVVRGHDLRYLRDIMSRKTQPGLES
jgi:O-antigen/teichoic acid export membrane protein